jgi:hypothetical protein
MIADLERRGHHQDPKLALQTLANYRRMHAEHVAHSIFPDRPRLCIVELRAAPINKQQFARRCSVAHLEQGSVGPKH